MADHPLDAVTPPLFFRLLIRRPVRLHGHRKLHVGVFREDVPLLIDQVPRKAVEIAYKVEEARGGRPRRFAVVRFRGRLFWPLHGLNSSAKATLSAAQRGTIDLFGAGLMVAPHEIDGEDLRIAEVFDDDNPSRAEIHRKAADLLLVDGDLHVAGGIPVVAFIDEKLVVVSTGGSRQIRPLVTGLALQPGGFGRPEADLALSAGGFWLRSEAAGRGPTMSGAGVTSNLVIEEVAPEPVDSFRVRLDAAVRVIDAAARRQRAVFGDEGGRSWRWVDIEEFIRCAMMDDQDADLRRIEVIHAALVALGPTWFDIAFDGHARNVLSLIAIGLGRGLKLPGYVVADPLTPHDDAALAKIVA